jgi:hypothetical protein
MVIKTTLLYWYLDDQVMIHNKNYVTSSLLSWCRMKDLELDLKQIFSKSYMLSFLMYTWNSLGLQTLVKSLLTWWLLVMKTSSLFPFKSYFCWGLSSLFIIHLFIDLQCNFIRYCYYFWIGSQFCNVSIIFLKKRCFNKERGFNF